MTTTELTQLITNKLKAYIMGQVQFSDVVTIVNSFDAPQKADLTRFLIENYPPVGDKIRAQCVSQATSQADTIITSGSITIAQLQELF
jgi:hypothetical protein